MYSKQLIRVKVSTRKQVAHEIVLFRLISLKGEPLPDCSPGSHIDVYLPGDYVRQYSICNTETASSGYEIAVLKDSNGRGGSLAMHELVHEGQSILISAPRNLFELEPSAKHTVLIAGGIGITPLLSMAEVLFRRGQSFELHYCSRSPQNAAFQSELLKADYGNRVKLYFDSDGDGSKLSAGKLLESCPSLEETHLYICGPAGFMDWVRSDASSAGLAPENIHVEHFAPPTASDREDQEFQILLQRSDRTITVPADRTALEALNAAGLDIPISCGQGICGTCLVMVVNGEIDHRDHYFSEQEKRSQDRFLPCCSRAKSSYLTIDL